MFTKELILDYADKLLIGLSDEEVDMLLKEFDVINQNMENVKKALLICQQAILI